MNPFRWVYRRAGQMICFWGAAFAFFMAAAAAADESNGMPAAVAGAALLLAGVGLKAIHVWQMLDDPMGED